jgi:hypothetical protein
MMPSSKAVLLKPNPLFCKKTARIGVWKRKTVTSTWKGRLIRLRTAEESGGTCTCGIVRFNGDNFMILRTYDDPKPVLAKYAALAVKEALEAIS